MPSVVGGMLSYVLYSRYKQVTAYFFVGEVIIFCCLSHQIPVSLHKMVSDRITNIVKGKDPDMLTGLQILTPHSHHCVHSDI